MSDVTVSRLGQVNLAGDAKAIFLKVYSGEVLTAFNAVNKFADRHTIRDIQAGKSAQFPATGHASASYHTPGNQLVGKTIPHAERVITIDDLLVSDVFIADIDAAMNHYDVRSEYTKQQGEALSKVFDTNVARVGILAARDTATIAGMPGGSFINAGANVRTDGSLIKSAMFAAAQKLDENNVVETDRFAFVRPATYYAAAATTDLINKDWAGRGSLADGTIETLAGITIVKTNHLPQSDDSAVLPAKYAGDFSNTGFLVMNRSAVGTVRLMNLSMQMEYLTTHQATLMVARYAVGHGILRPECAVEIRAVAP